MSARVDPGAIFAGQRMKKGVRMPPSKKVAFQPRKGAFRSGIPLYQAPPLSLVKMTSVLSSIPACLSFAITSPMRWSSCAIIAP